MTGVCPEDGVLVALVDGALEEERQAVEGHVRECGRCASRLEALRARDRAVRAWLERHDPPPPARAEYRLDPGRGTWPRRRWLAAAAVLVAVLVGVGPARGWMVDAVRAILGPPAEEAPAVAEPGPGGLDGATAFQVQGSELEVLFRSTVTGGRLHVEPSLDSLVRVIPPGPGVDVRVRPGVLEIDNRESPTGAYRLMVPEALETMRLRIPGVLDTVVDLSSPAGERSIPLAGGG